MKRKTINTIFGLFSIIFLSVIYYNSEHYIKTHHWKYNGSLNIDGPDMFGFEPSLGNSINKGFIYINGKSVYKIIFTYYDNIYVKELNSGKIVRYTAK